MQNSAQTILPAAGLGESPSRRAAPLLALSLTVLLASLGTSIANVGLPTLAAAFGASFRQVQWVVLAYLLAVTTSIVAAGRLGDLWGRRRLLLAGLGLFTGASLLCGLAPSLGLLIAARALQGFGAAFMMVLALAMVGESVPPQRAGSAMGWLGTMSAVGTFLGPSLGGVLIALFGWRGIFLVTLPLGLVAAHLAGRALPPERAPVAPAGRGFDLGGALLLATALGAYALSMTAGRSGFGPINLALLAAAAIAAALFVRSQRRSPVPLVRLEKLREVQLRQGLTASLLVSAVMMGTLVVGPFYLSASLGLSAAGVGLVLSIGPLVAALCGVPAGRLADRWSPRPIASLGLCAMTAACLALTWLPVGLGLAGYVVPMAALAAGYALFQTANNKAVMARSGVDRGLVSGLLNLSRNLGLVTGACLLGAIFAAACGSAGSSPAGIALGMRTSFAVAAVLAGAALAVTARPGGQPGGSAAA